MALPSQDRDEPGSKSSPMGDLTRRRALRLICRLLAAGCVVAMVAAASVLARLLSEGRLDGPWTLTPKLLMTIIVVCAFAMVGLLAAYPRTPDES